MYLKSPSFISLFCLINFFGLPKKPLYLKVVSAIFLLICFKLGKMFFISLLDKMKF